MNTIRYHIAVCLAVLAVALAGCKKDRLGIEPTPPPKPEPKVATFEVTARSESGNVEKGTEGKLETDKVVISGLGTYKAGETAKVVVTPKEGFVCDGIYFEYTSGYDASAFPTTAETALKVSEVSFEVKGNITLQAIVSKYEEPIVQPEYAKNVLINEDYWRQKNREAWNEIYPKIVREPDEEYETGYVASIINASYPNLHASMRTDTIYREESTVLAFKMSVHLSIYPGEYEQVSYEQGYQVAYAFADKSGAIREIYPPCYWDGRATFDSMGNIVVFPTLPEGEYSLRVLLNTPDRRDKWYDVPLRDYCRFEHFKNNKIENHKTKEVYDTHNFTEWGIVTDDQLKRDQLFWTEEIRAIHVVERNSVDAPPIPRWYHPLTYMSEVQTEENRSRFMGLRNLNCGFHKGKKSVKFRIANGCNQTLKGKIIAVCDYHHYYNQNLHILDQYEKNLKDQYYPEVGGMERGGCLPEWTVTIGEKEVTIPGNTDDTEVSVVYDNPMNVKSDWAWDSCTFGGKVVQFYWQPEGSDRSYFMQQSYHDVLNIIEKEEKMGNPYRKMWLGGTYETSPTLSYIIAKYMPEYTTGLAHQNGQAAEWESYYCNFLNYAQGRW